MKTRELRSRPLKELLELQKRVSAAIKTRQAQMKKARERVMALATKLGADGACQQARAGQGAEEGADGQGD